MERPHPDRGNHGVPREAEAVGVAAQADIRAVAGVHRRRESHRVGKGREAGRQVGRARGDWVGVLEKGAVREVEVGRCVAREGGRGGDDVGAADRQAQLGDPSCRFRRSDVAAAGALMTKPSERSGRATRTSETAGAALTSAGDRCLRVCRLRVDPRVGLLVAAHAPPPAAMNNASVATTRAGDGRESLSMETPVRSLRTVPPVGRVREWMREPSDRERRGAHEDRRYSRPALDDVPSPHGN